MQSLLYCKVLGRKPGWKDSNFQVMNAKFGVVAVLAEKAKVFGKKSVSCVMPSLVEKLGDIKVFMQSVNIKREELTLFRFPLPHSDDHHSIPSCSNDLTSLLPCSFSIPFPFQ